MAKDIRIAITDEGIKLYLNGVEIINVAEETVKTSVNSFDEAVDFLTAGDPESFLNVARYAKTHHNKFPKMIRELSGVVNADDAYCSAIIKLARPLGKEVENTFFCLFKEAVDGNKKAEENFIEMWDSLHKLNRLCGSFNDCI